MRIPCTPLLLAFLTTLCFTAAAADGANLIPNGDMSAKDPAEGFFISFPYQGMYVDNSKYVKVGQLAGRTCILMEGPDKLMGMKGIKVLSPLAKIEQGKTYKASVDLYRQLKQTHFKIFVELYAVDPRPNPTLSPVQTMQIPAEAGHHPALILVYKRDLTLMEGIPPEKWTKVSTDVVVPAKDNLKVLGKPAEASYATIKVIALGSGFYDFTHTAGASHFELK